ncbi:Alanine--glyoxylate aminotransferase 2-like [Hypsibius exemplaris]|uniref:Alanine--glyoxylate aminotransferase 2-like n=1 Tax=Hypsibius exemplaris TaxID=2072580 RepID=A0A1W0XAB7_HYPEX|nr:Alanine--glyoxylate aminotransferase 2-like [Hypsibius exemplaris]
MAVQKERGLCNSEPVQHSTVWVTQHSTAQHSVGRTAQHSTAQCGSAQQCGSHSTVQCEHSTVVWFSTAVWVTQHSTTQHSSVGRTAHKSNIFPVANCTSIMAIDDIAEGGLSNDSLVVVPNGLTVTKDKLLPASLQSTGISETTALTKADTLALRNKHISNSCTVFFHENPLKIVRAQRQYMYDENGIEYLDCINNVAHVGHCHPKVVAAAANQLAQQCTNSRFLHDNMVLCAQKIASTMPEQLSVVFFVNSGSEANDLAIRLSRHYTGHKDVVILDHAYHGTTITTTDISPHKWHHLKDYKQKKWVHVAPQPDAYRGMFRSPEHTDADLGRLYAGEVEKITDRIAKEGRGVGLFLAESLQSCAGQVFLPEGYLKPVYEAVRSTGGLCLADEVQTGFGRIGTHYWAFQEQGVIPDFVTIGKSMGNGFPVAALVTTPEIAGTFVKMGIEYFNSYGGNAASCAATLAVMQVIEDEQLQNHAKRVGDYFLTGLIALQKKHRQIGDVRGKGLFLGIEIVSDRVKRIPDACTAHLIIMAMRARNVILSVEGPADNVVKIKPPMCFTTANVDLLLGIMDECLSSAGEAAVAIESAIERDHVLNEE